MPTIVYSVSHTLVLPYFHFLCSFFPLSPFPLPSFPPRPHCLHLFLFLSLSSLFMYWFSRNSSLLSPTSGEEGRKSSMRIMYNSLVWSSEGWIWILCWKTLNDFSSSFCLKMSLRQFWREEQQCATSWTAPGTETTEVTKKWRKDRRMEKLRSGSLGSLIRKLQHPGSPARLLHTIE